MTEIDLSQYRSAKGEPTVGWIGLGKLGLPCALALEQHANVNLVGYDRNPAVADIVTNNLPPTNTEEGLADLIDGTQLKLAGSIAEVVADVDELIFMAVQTPHDAAYGGELPMPHSRKDFDYRWLREAVAEVSAASDEQHKQITLVIISTALPGTLDREIVPDLGDGVTLLYNPFFIAMGTTVADFLHPEFVLIGAERHEDTLPLIDLWDRLLDLTVTPIRVMSYKSAELTKVAYNTFISLKITFANTMLEICQRTGADVDDVIETLCHGDRRILSPAYMRGGMGDGGACHPRDNIAMSWLARSAELSADPFEFVTRAREAQTLWMARQIKRESMENELPVVLLGKSYKPGSDLIYGSPALLLANYLADLGVEFDHWDHYVDGVAFTPNRSALYVVCTKHPEYQDEIRFPFGSVIIDPFRYVNPQPGVEILALGRGQRF